MRDRYKDYSARLMESWVSSIQRKPGVVLILLLCTTIIVLAYDLTHFRINTDVSGMISRRLHFRAVEDDFGKAFPNLSDTVVAVIDGESADIAISARDRLAEQLKKYPQLFKSINVPGGGSFFEKNGLLFLSVNELENFADSMAAAQPLLAFLSEDLSLKSLFAVMEKALQQPETSNRRIDLLCDRMSMVFEGVVKHQSYLLPWQEIMLGEKESAGQRRQFIILRPYMGKDDLFAAEKALDAVRSAWREAGLTPAAGLKLRLTGDVALNAENMREVRNSVGIATVASLILVAGLLYIGFGGQLRLIFAALTTLLVGLIWTTGFALAFIGSFNMISITFAVLFIGLGIDYSIQFCLRYKELNVLGEPYSQRITTTAKGVGRALLVSCVTTALGFYSFIPTAYAGVAELGLISGTGMFISFFANMTVLPAFLSVVPVTGRKNRTAPKFVRSFFSIPYEHPKAVILAAVLLGLASSVFLPKLYFDYNPLNLYNPGAEPVVIIKELFQNTEAPPWTISVLSSGEDGTKKLAERLRALKEVKMVVTLADFVPDNQREKLEIISDIGLFMPPNLSLVTRKHGPSGGDAAALGSFESAIKNFTDAHPEKKSVSVLRLYKSIQDFKSLTADPSDEKKAFEALEEGLLSGLPGLFVRLQTSLNASSFGIGDLPGELREEYRSTDGRYRIQVFPAENIMDRKALAAFVRSVQRVAPDATDAPVTIYESGLAVASSFQQAVLYALVAILLFLFLEMRSVFATIVILLPLVLAILLTAAAATLLGIPLNFANVIVVPLLLGTGVHSGIIFVLRYQTEPPASGNMLHTSTARAVLLSFLTSMISTGSLSFSAHRGIASMGILLTICFGFLIFSVLIFLPALIELYKDHLRTKR